jgi:tetratricopeptide (TPR) repeat protein
MSAFNSIFDGLLGYEKLMLICGFILFVFALAAITVMIVQRRDFRMAMVLIIFAIVLMGFPGIQAIKFSQDTVELDRIRARPGVPTDPAQQQQSAQTLSSIEERSAGNPQLQAQVADGYRAIGEVDKGYQLAQSLLQQKPSAQVQATLVPVLTAKLNQVQADAPIAPSPEPAPSAGSSTSDAASTPPAATATAAPDGAGTAATTPPATPSPTEGSEQREIATIARQLQGTGAPLPAASHAALARAYVVLGQPQQAQANVDAALRLNPDIRINAAVLHAARMGSTPRPPEH